MEKGKWLNPCEALRRAITPGCRIFFSMASAQPRTLLQALADDYPYYHNVEVLNVYPVADNPLSKPGLESSFRCVSLQNGAPIVADWKERRIDFIPARYSDIPAIYSPGGPSPIDVALIQVAPPDGRGRFSLGASASLAYPLARGAKKIVAEVNDRCVGIPTSNPLWHEDVLVSCKKLVDNGVPSLGWDQYWTTTATEPNMQSLTRKIREYALRHDPDASFSGEELWNLEIASGYLDFTWNWGGWRDCAALTSVLPTPRVNSCINSSPLAVKKAFADNLYLNILPRRKESANATDWIANYPDMSHALKQCAARR